MIVLDTSVLVESLTGRKLALPALREAVARAEALIVPAPVLYEWLRGPRLEEELATQKAFFPEDAYVPFGPAEAAAAAQLYRSVARAPSRQMDLAIAASAIVREAELWTLNATDFEDIPGLRLYSPRS